MYSNINIGLMHLDKQSRPHCLTDTHILTLTFTYTQTHIHSLTNTHTIGST